jgi:hypothetical protein
MEVVDLTEEIRDLAELFVCIDLFEVSLGQTVRIFAIESARSLHQDSAFLPCQLPANRGTTLFVLSELKQVAPLPAFSQVDFDVQEDGGVFSNMEASDLTHAVAGRDRRLEPALGFGEIAEKPKRIEKIRFA